MGVLQLTCLYLGFESDAMLKGLFIVEGNAGIVEVFDLIVLSVSYACSVARK